MTRHPRFFVKGGLMVPARVYRVLYKNTDTRESHVSCIIRICNVFLYFMYFVLWAPGLVPAKRIEADVSPAGPRRSSPYAGFLWE